MAHCLEIREWAIRILSADNLDEKLLSPYKLTDNNPGTPLLWESPTRPPGMEFKIRSKQEKLPPLCSHHDPDKRAICLHRFAGHELLAVEIMAYTLLACPNAPKHFRKGLASTLKEEQEHVRLYMEELKRFGVNFGDMPLYKHFWAHTPYITDPITYVSTMCLTLEQANLDFAPIYKDSFNRAGDEESAQLMQRIVDDEIAHVSFGYHWLKRLTPKEKNAYEMWCKSLSPLMTTRRARGPIYHPEHRNAVGFDQEWMKQFESSFQ